MRYINLRLTYLLIDNLVSHIHIKIVCLFQPRPAIKARKDRYVAVSN